MRNILLLSFAVIFLFSCKSENKEIVNPSSETTVYYLIRHAEKDRNTPDQDPSLTNIGLERAAIWAKIFAPIKLDQIYSTNYKRTQQTALPTASEKKLKILSYNSDSLYNVDFKRKTKGKTVLIVGHSNTTPAFVNTILGEQKYNQIEDRDNGKLFIVTLVNQEISVVIQDHN